MPVAQNMWQPISMQSVGELATELAAPVAEVLVGDHHTPLGQNAFDVAQAEAEQVIQPHRVADDLAGEAVAEVQEGLAGHADSLASARSSHQWRSTWQCLWHS